jgi:DNA repair protein RecO
LANNNLKRSLVAKPTFFEESLITSVVRYGESDCIVKLFTKNKGRLTAFYRRGLKDKKSGVVQALALGQVGLIKNHGKLLQMVSCDLDANNFDFSDIKNFAYRAYLSEIVEKFLPEEEPAYEIYEALVQAFSALKVINSGILRAFEVKILNYCGYWPEIPNGLVMAFDPKNFYFTPEKNQENWEFSNKALEIARSMLIAKIGHINYEDSLELLMIGRIFQNRVRLMGYELKSASFLKQIQY